MAEQKKKTTAGGTSGSKASNSKKQSAKSAPKRSSTGAAAKAAAAQKRLEERRRHRRRALWALALAALGLFTLLGYFTTDGVVIRLLRGLLTGLFGGGFYLLPPMLIIAAGILAISRDEHIGGRVVSAVSVPVIVAAFCQIFSKADYSLSGSMFKALWTDGQNVVGGGALGGCLAILFKTLFGVAGAAIVLVCLGTLAVMSITGLTLRSLIDLVRDNKNARTQRELEEYMNEPEPEPEPVRPAPVKGTTRRRAIDIPMDETDTPAPEPAREEKKGGLFNRKGAAPAPDSVYATREEQTAGKTAQDEPLSVRQARERGLGINEAIERTREPAPAPVPLSVEVVSREAVKPAASAAAAVTAASAAAAASVQPPARDAVPAPEPPKTETVGRGEAEKEAQAIGSLIEEGAKRDLAEAMHEYKFPPVSLLSEPVRQGSRDSQDELMATKERLELCLRSFGVNVTVSNIVHGPSITRYEMELEIGVKLNKLTNLADDIALALGVTGVRIAAIPNRISTVGIEVPNKNVSTVYLREIITAPEFKNAKSKLTFAIGKNISGDVMVGNISKLPHLLVAGTTGSGKSVCLNSLILSLMYKATPEEVKFIMIDPKMVEFKIYNGIPHLLIPVVTEAKKAAGALQWAVVEMMKRYRIFSDAGARDIAGYNEQLAPGDAKMPQIVVIIDELADLMMIAAKEVEESICRVAQMGRAAGVHLVIATQSPRADVITGLMKANIPSRIALKVASSLESRIILDAGGAADKLVGNGDMLYAPIGASKPTRIQGTWVSDAEREQVVEYVKNASGEASYSEDVIYEIEKAVQDKENGGKAAQPSGEDKFKDYDELLPQAADIIFETNQASVSMLQRRLKLGYARAARIVDQLEEVGVLGPFEGSKPRQIVITRAQWQEMQFLNGTAPTEGAPAPEPVGPEQTVFTADDLFDEGE